METATKRLYEAMFLVDSALAASDWEGTMGAIDRVLQRADAEVVHKRKWSERRMAYDMKKSSRGTYILCYFKADTQAIAALEKDVQLTEQIIRVLVLSAEDRPEGFNDRDMEDITSATEMPDKDTPPVEVTKESPAETPTEVEVEVTAAEAPVDAPIAEAQDEPAEDVTEEEPTKTDAE
ncbi:30S ribosomal protein S6 [Planctomycetota bacterium]